jgi:DNA polymerase IV
MTATSTPSPPSSSTSLTTPILHVDMDAFYASVAVRERPELHDVPVIVGGGSRGVVLSANYLARKTGVRSALPMTRARRMCPEAVVIAPDFETFMTVSSSVMENFRRVTPLVEVLSLDEAFLDVRGSTRRLGTPVEIAEHLRATIHDEQGITCSVGVAGSMTMAKLASRWAKPDGVVVCPPSSVTTMLHPLDVGELYGVGEKTRELLHRLGLVTVGDLAHTPVRTLQRALGHHLGRHLHDLSWGVDERQVVARTSGSYFGVLGGDPDKSMGANETFAHDTDDRAAIVRELLRLTDRVTSRMRVAGVAGRTVTITVRFADFTTITRSRTLPAPTDVAQLIYTTACALYEAAGLPGGARLRLVGVRASGLLPAAPAQAQLAFGDRPAAWREAEQAIDQIAGRFGLDTVRPAALVRGRKPSR